MPSGTARVTKYSLSIRPLNQEKRIISLDTQPLTGDSINSVFIQFFSPVTGGNGNFASNSGFVGVRLDQSNFAEIFQLLQTEAPVEVDIRSNAQNAITEFRIGMPQPGGQEPPGEGPADANS